MTILYPEIEPYEHGFLDMGAGQQLYWEACGIRMEPPLSTCTAALAPVARHPLAAIFDPSVYRIILFDQRNCGRSLPNATDMADTFVTAWELSRAWPESRLVTAEDAAHSVS